MMLNYVMAQHCLARQGYSNIQACYVGTIIDRVDIFYIVIPAKQWYSEVTLRNGLVKWGDVT